MIGPTHPMESSNLELMHLGIPISLSSYLIEERPCHFPLSKSTALTSTSHVALAEAPKRLLGISTVLAGGPSASKKLETTKATPHHYRYTTKELIMATTKDKRSRERGKPTGHNPRAFPTPEDLHISQAVANVAHSRRPNNDKSQPRRWTRKAVAHTRYPSLISLCLCPTPWIAVGPQIPPPYPWLSRSLQVRPAEPAALGTQRQSARPLFSFWVSKNFRLSSKSIPSCK